MSHVADSPKNRRRSPVGARPSASRGGPVRHEAVTPPSWRTNWRVLGMVFGERELLPSPNFPR